MSRSPRRSWTRWSPSCGRSTEWADRWPKSRGQRICPAARSSRPASDRRCSASSGGSCDLEVDAEHRDPQREPTEVVVAGSKLAAARVSFLDRPPVRGDAAGDLVGGSVERDSGLVAVRRPSEAPLHVGGRVGGRKRARREPGAARRRTREPIDAEGAPVLALRSQATRYQRRPTLTSECGSTSRRLSVPSRLR